MFMMQSTGPINASSLQFSCNNDGTYGGKVNIYTQHDLRHTPRFMNLTILVEN